MICCALYIGSAAAANLAVAAFGPLATIPSAVLLIGCDFTVRDSLHDHWSGRLLWPRMAALVAAGAAVSWLANPSAGRISIASVVAFAASGLTDALAYQALRGRSRLARVNGSNLVSSLVDSLLFPTIAFGAVLPLICAGQFAAKVIGGALWSLALGRRHG